MDISAGKYWSLRRLADENGRFKMVAADQRPPIMNLIASKTGPDSAGYAEIAAVKELLTRNLAGESSAVLLDPIWGYSQSIGVVHPRQGMLLTVEDHDFEERSGGRLSRLIADWDVAKVKRAGADGVKLLAWYRPDADAEVCKHQRDLVERVGRACAEHDICFLLELLVYPLPNERDQTKEYIEYSAKRPELVVESVRTFADPRFGVDVFKVESPVPASEVPPADSTEAADCQRWFDELGRAATRPWVMLSAGADMEAFRRVLTYAYRAGCSGYLAGRAIWWPAVQMYPDLASVEQELKSQGIGYLQEINELTDEEAQPWTAHPAFAEGIGLAGAGPDFPKKYALSAVQ